MISWILSETVAHGGSLEPSSAGKCYSAETFKSGSKGFDVQNTWVIFRRCVNRSLNVFESSADIDLINP